MLFSSLPAHSQLDSIEQQYFDSIEWYQEQDSLLAYLNKMIDLKYYYSEYFKKKKDQKKAVKERSKKMLFLTSKYSIYREPKSDEEKLAVRWYYATKFYWTWRTTGNYAQALPIAFKGTEYAIDPIYLDKHAHALEMEIASTFARQDDFSRAILYYEKCIVGFRKRNELERLSKLYANTGDAYKWVNDFKTAKSYFNKGIELANKIKCTDCYLANHTRLRDLAYDQKDYKLFLKLADEDRKLLNENKKLSKTTSRLLELDDAVANYHFNQKQYLKALSLFERTKNTMLSISQSKFKRQVAKVSIKIARCHFHLNDQVKFRKEITECNNLLLSDFYGILPPDSILYAENTFLDLFDLCSDFYKKKFHDSEDLIVLDTSLLFLDKAIHVGQLLDQKIIYSDSKDIFANSSKKYVDKAVENFFLRHKNASFSKRDLIQIRNLFNASKDQILKDKIELSQKVDLLDSKTKTTIDSLISIIVTELGNNNPDKKTIFECQDKIEFITGIKVSKQNYTSLKGDYIEYLITSENVYVLGKMNNKIDFVKIGKKSRLDTLVIQFNESIIQKESSEEIKLSLSHLYNFLVPKTWTLSSEFTIIPDGLITTIPFDLLRFNNQYLIENHLTSTSTHYLQHINNKSNRGLNIYCVSPDYSSDLASNKTETDRSGLYPLPFAKEEVTFIESIFSKSFKVDTTNSPLNISKNLKDASAFHFTGHAKVNMDSAYLVLNNEHGIYKWSYEQIYHNNFDLGLVTLSACETGLGQVQFGDGLNSVARSFLGAGADAVVYSLWTVNDMSTSSIMKDFYSELKKGVSKDQAIRVAKIKYLNTANPDRKHPYYWGGFVAAGDMSPVVIHNNYSYLKILFFTSILIVVFFFLYKTFKTKHL